MTSPLPKRRSFTSAVSGAVQLLALVVPLIRWWQARKLPAGAVVTDQQEARDVKKRRTRSKTAEH